jgi:hypothetical protein
MDITLHSCACHPASSWLDTLPLSQALELKSREFQTVFRHRFGLAILPLKAPTGQCGCKATLRHTNTDQGMRCPALAAHFLLGHDILKGIFPRAVHQAGVASAPKPALSRLPSLAAAVGVSAGTSPACCKCFMSAVPVGL